MKTMQRNFLMLALSSALALPALAADAAKDAHSGHHPAPADAAAAPATAPQAAAPTPQAMRERMQAIRAEKDPAKRKEMMMMQMQDMEAMMEKGACPMMAEHKGGGMMGGSGMGMMQGKGCMMGQGMQGGMGNAMDGAIEKRMDALERRVDILQMMMQMHMGGLHGR